jgi:LmbE family N-acetylglucosaminyl deacetylase
VVAVGAHPDDVELGAGGFLARLARRGARAVIAVASIPSRSEERLLEARRAAEVIGAELVLVGGPDPARVEDMPMHRLVARLDELLGAERPELVLTHSARDIHWDHQLVHRATVAALRRTPCDALAFVSGPETGAAALFGGTFFADIGETLEVKLAALGAHATQGARGSFDLDACRDFARALGRIAGVRHAEAFEVLRMTV